MKSMVNSVSHDCIHAKYMANVSHAVGPHAMHTVFINVARSHVTSVFLYNA